MKKVTFQPAVIFYIKESEDHQIARQSTLQQERADKQRFKDRINAVGEILFPVLKYGKNCKSLQLSAGSCAVQTSRS